MSFIERTALAIAVIGLALTGCYRTDGPERGDSLTQTDPDPDTDTGPDTASDTEQLVTQGPLSFVVVNQKEVPVYLDWSRAIEFLRCTEATCQTVAFFQPWCTVDCEDVNSLGSCCIDCEDLAPAVYVVPPQSSRSFDWDGRVWNPHTAPCGGECECYAGEAPLAGPHQALVSVGLGMACDGEQGCPDPVDGVIWGATLEDVQDPVSVDFTVPTTQGAVEIAILPE